MAAVRCRWGGVAAFVLIWPSLAAAEGQPSFDCATAKQPVDRLICSDNELAARDAAMAVAFTAARSRAAGSAERATLLAEQRDWLAGRERACPAAVAASTALKEGYRDAVIGCLAGLYEQRIATLDYDHNQSDWPHLPFRPSLVEGAGQKLCEDLRRDLDISFLGPGLFVNPLGEREIGFAPVTLPGTGEVAETQFTLQWAEFDPHNGGRPVVVLQGIFDNGGLHLPTVRYWQLPSAAALAALLHQKYWDSGIDDLGKPIIDTQAFPRDTTTESRPFVLHDSVLSVDETPHYFRYAGRVYLLAPLQPEAKGMADAGVYELSGPAGIKRRCLFHAHFPMAYYAYDAPPLDTAAEAEDVGSVTGPLLPAGKVCESAGDGPRTLWDHEAYRPWVLEHRSWSEPGIDPPALARYLRNRSLTGLERHLAYWHFVSAREHAIDANAHYFVERFARPVDEARRLAALQIDWNLIDGSMIFSDDPETTALLAPDFEPSHLLQAAILDGDAEKVKSLLGADAKEAARHAQTTLDEPLLSDALQHPEILRQLLAAKLDPNETGSSGRTPLMVAARIDLTDAARILLEEGAAIDADTGDKVTSIYPAADQVLCQQGGEWDPNDTPGRTALSYAAKFAAPEMVALLLAHGAVADKADSTGHKPADYAAERSDKITAQKIAVMLQSAK